MICLKISCLLSIIILSTFNICYSDIVYLKNGGKIEAKSCGISDNEVSCYIDDTTNISFKIEDVKKVEIKKAPKSKCYKDGFKFDKWSSGMSIEEAIETAKYYDLPMAHNIVSGHHKHFDKRLIGNYQKYRIYNYRSDSLLGKPARVNLYFTKNSKLLYKISIDWLIAAYKYKNNFYKSIDDLFSNKYKYLKEYMKNIITKCKMWRINHNSFIIKEDNIGDHNYYYIDNFLCQQDKKEKDLIDARIRYKGMLKDHDKL